MGLFRSRSLPAHIRHRSNTRLRQNKEPESEGSLKPDDYAGPQVKVPVDDLQQLLLALLGGAVGEQGDGQRVGDADRVRHL